MKSAEIINKDNSIKVSSAAVVADSFLRRFSGLMFRRPLVQDEAMIFYNSGSIHTCFMRFPIDIVFLDKNGKVIKIKEAVKPWRFVSCVRSRVTVEMPAHRCSKTGVNLGHELSFFFK